jgi:hypothetical protein
MSRRTLRLLLAGLAAVALAAFLAVKLLPPRGGPPIEVRSEGRDQRLARGALVTALKRLFPKGDSHWQIVKAPPGGYPDSGCLRPSTAYRSSTGRAVSADYVFARWLAVRLATYTYANSPAAQRALSPSGASQVAACLGHAVAEELRREGYVVGKPRVFPSVSAHIGESARSRRIEIPSRYGARRYDWDLDSTSVRRGRIVLIVETSVGGAFLEPNERLAGGLVAGGLGG